MVLGYSPSKSGMRGMIHNLLLEIAVLPNVLALALHQVNYLGWMDQGHHSWYPATLVLKVRVD